MPTSPHSAGTPTIKISAKTSRSAGLRAPKYVSQNTLSIAVLLNTVNGATPAPTPAPLVENVTATTNGCAADGTNPGNYACTISTTFPIAADNVTVTAYDAQNATGNILSRTTATFTPTAGTATNVNLTFGANPNAMTITAPTASSFVSGSISSGFTFVGAGPQIFAVSFTDPSGATIVGPGNPSITVAPAGTAFSAPAVSNSGFMLNASGYSASAAAITVNACPPRIPDSAH